MRKDGNKYTSEKMNYDEELKQDFPLWKFEVDPDSGEMLWYGYDSAMGYKKMPVHSGYFGSLHLRWLMNECPERLEQILDEKRFQDYLDGVQERGTDMMLEIIEKMQRTERDYLIALESGDVVEQMRLRNNYELCAKEIVRDQICFC
ncbi:MAG: TnpV protein [Acutalibacteraceae bacterium]|nr:TnpV protein [Acutalibacteraceae bacterium]